MVNMSSDLSAFQRIKSLTKDALAAFEKRDVTLKELSINEVYPVIEDIANRLMSGPATRYLFFFFSFSARCGALVFRGKVI